MLIQDPSTPRRGQERQALYNYIFLPAHPAINTQIRVTRIKMGGCIAFRPVRTFARLRSLTVRFTKWLGARLTKICSCLERHTPSRSVKTYPRLSEPGLHIPVEISPVADYHYEDQIDRYDWAYAEMCLPKSERLRRQSTPDPPALSCTNSNMPAADADKSESSGWTDNPFPFF